MFARITSDPEILSGKPCIKGTRISVEFVLELFASGATHNDLLETYPHLTIEGITEALQYAARPRARSFAYFDHFVVWTKGSTLQYTFSLF